MVEKFIRDGIRDRRVRIGIIGLGYVGLPLALLFCRKGFHVIGYDVNREYVANLRDGKSSIVDVSDQALVEALATMRFLPTPDLEELSDADIFIICVPTPLSKTRQPDLSYIEKAVDDLKRIWSPHKLVVLESTTYPGTTDELLLPALCRGGTKVDQDFLLAYSPERVDPGNVSYPLESIPKVVGGVSEASTRAAADLYRTVFPQVHEVSHARAAELTKLLENTFRNVNIALANEFKQLCDTLGVDVWEVIDAAKTKPFGFMPFYPGPGIGGHCIPLDPRYLVYKARLAGYEPRLVALADQINQEMPHYTVRQVMDALNRHGKALHGSKVIVVGVAYKPDVPDLRESPALFIMEELMKRGAEVRFFDPYFDRLSLADGNSMASVALTKDLLDSSDAILILTAHRELPYDLIGEYWEKVIDTRNCVSH